MATQPQQAKDIWADVPFESEAELAPEGLGNQIPILTIDKDLGQFVWAGVEKADPLGKSIEVCMIDAIAMHVRQEDVNGDYKTTGEHRAIECPHGMRGFSACKEDGFRLSAVLIALWPDRIADTEAFAIRLSSTATVSFNKQVAQLAQFKQKPYQAMRWTITLPERPEKIGAGSAYIPTFTPSGILKDEYPVIREMIPAARAAMYALTGTSNGNGTHELPAGETPKAITAPVDETNDAGDLALDVANPFGDDD